MQKSNMMQIAKACNVSLKTVSRVLNHPDQVSDKTKEAVRIAMEKNGFQINLLAKGLKQKRTNIIVIFLDKHHGDYLNAWRNMMLRYLFRHTGEAGLKLVLSPSDNHNFMENESDGFHLMTSGIADGAILFEHIEQDRRVEYFERMHVPFVVLGQPRRPDIPAVSLENFDVGYQGGRYLKEKGYRRVVYLTNEKTHYSTELRAKGFLKAFPEGQVVYGLKTAQEIYRATKQILQVDSPECIFVRGDEGFLEVYRAAGELGLCIPEDLAVLSGDNLPIHEAVYPSVSCVYQDFQEIAKGCMELLTAQLEGTEPPRGIQFFVPSTIIERKSTQKK